MAGSVLVECTEVTVGRTGARYTFSTMHQERDEDEVKDDNTMLQDAVNAFMSGDAEVEAVATALRSSPPPTQLASCTVCTPASWKRLLKLRD